MLNNDRGACVRRARRSDPPPHRRAARRRRAHRGKPRRPVRGQSPRRLAAPARAARERPRARARRRAAPVVLPRPHAPRRAGRVAAPLPRLLGAAPRRPRHRAAACPTTEGASMIDMGRLRPDGDRCAVRLERLYDATPDELWSALTDAEQLRGWMAEVTRIDARPGGEFEFRFGDAETEWAAGRVLRADPPRLLELDWTFPGEPASTVRFEIHARAPGALLVLDHSRLDRESGASYSAGWHAHLDLLEAQLGHTPEPD